MVSAKTQQGVGSGGLGWSGSVFVVGWLGSFEMFIIIIFEFFFEFSGIGFAKRPQKKTGVLGRVLGGWVLWFGGGVVQVGVCCLGCWDMFLADFFPAWERSGGLVSYEHNALFSFSQKNVVFFFF